MIGYQVPFRHLCNLLQIHELDVAETIASLSDVKPEQMDRLVAKATCAKHWLEKYAPEDFRFHLATLDQENVALGPQEQKAVAALAKVVEAMDDISPDEFSTRMYACAKDNDLQTPDFFKAVYQVLIAKDRGPKLADFIHSCGKAKVLPILQRYC
jgi:lysyl-tRNA synthetase class 1